MRNKHYTAIVEHCLRLAIRQPTITNEVSKMQANRCVTWLNELSEPDRIFLKVVYGKVPNIKYPTTYDGLKLYGGDTQQLYLRLDKLHRDFAVFNSWI